MKKGGLNYKLAIKEKGKLSKYILIKSKRLRDGVLDSVCVSKLSRLHLYSHEIR